MKNSIPVKALFPVFLFLSLLLLLYMLIGGDKANFAINLLGMPWTAIFEVDPYGHATRAEQLFSFYSGVFINTGIIYVLSIALLLIKKSNEKEK